jgi:glycosyltransferase involved in cell wall biosynthesis
MIVSSYETGQIWNKYLGKMMKLLHLYRAYYPEIEGGIPYLIKEFLELPENETKNEILVTSIKKPKKIDLRILTTRSYGNFFSIPLSPAYLATAFRILSRYDAIIAHTPFPVANLILLFAKKQQKKLIFWHADIIKNKILKFMIRPLINLSLKQSDIIIVGHEKIIESTNILQKYYKKCFVLPFPIEKDKFECELSHKIADRVVACGRLVKYKGFLNLIRASKNIEAEFIIIGEGPERNNLEKEIIKLKLTDKVRLLGHISEEDKIKYLKSASIFVFSSNTEQETFGIAQLEAMAAGCAIVNTSLNTAVPLIARHNIEALTIEPDNPYQLAEKIQLLLDDNKLRSELSIAGVKRVEMYFSKEEFQKNVSRLFLRCGSGKPNT